MSKPRVVKLRKCDQDGVERYFDDHPGVHYGIAGAYARDGEPARVDLVIHAPEAGGLIVLSFLSPEEVDFLVRTIRSTAAEVFGDPKAN